ncbi:hypothetical protein [Citrobacter freundii]|uniref:hypothetical protein n=1 Tax=Citrobacter freundii TaxID=546 RepID=UPI00224685BA|nr:hypothetical protein [Citrobacter freundii]MCX2442341.1 hypothetical protein [Citrobacter freundii]MCX2470811.1 hypothetical protein [Citrobacter freundii]UZQ87640.1 hypothetical protein OQW59_15570 [Citrobacter freundii]UZQ98483.1 hypothetical protein OQZ20_15700 [Citrobacter freundii]HCJ7698457.1 hypothetical protein [Citrobacter freundii]
MAKFIESIKLRSILPNTLIVNFIREDLADKDVDVSLALKADMSDKDEYVEGNPLKLVFTAKIKGSSTDDKSELVSLVFATDYLFELVDKDEFFSHSDEEIVKLGAALTYLDFRAKLSSTLVSIGMSKVKLPPNMIDLAGE